MRPPRTRSTLCPAATLFRSCRRCRIFFNDTATTEIYTLSLHDALPISMTSTIPVASARMYSWAPTLTAAWTRLLEWVSARAGNATQVLEIADPYPLEALWARDDLGCVFMCGYPWALRTERPHLLAAPVPSPPRYRGQPIYFTDFIVRADSTFTTLEDTFGGCM